MVFLLGKWERHLSFHHKISYFWNVNIFTFWTFHLLRSNSFEQILIHLLWKLHSMPFWPCLKRVPLPSLIKLCQATRWFHINPKPYESNNIARSNAIFPFYSILSILAISIQKWASYLPQLQWCSYLVDVHNILLSTFNLIGANPFYQYLAYFLCNAISMP